MKKKLRGFYLLLSSFVLSMFHFPYAAAKSVGENKTLINLSRDFNERSSKLNPTGIGPIFKSIYDSLHLNVKGMSLEAFEYAKMGLVKLVSEGKLLNDSIISIVDFSLPSNRKRLFVLDIKNYRILFNTLVAHGRNTGREWATTFSNLNSSYQSSPGFYITGETYQGKHGLSLKLEGIEKGINDNAYERGIVIHGAAYVSESLANIQGYIGRSQGCPAVPENTSIPIINTIKNGSCLFIYHPSYINRSIVLR
jgi:hypothetical protein